VYPCGKDTCSVSTGKPHVRFKDTRGVDWGEEDNQQVNIKIIDTKDRTKISVEGMSMNTPHDIVRRRNIVRSIVNTMDGASIEIKKAGFSDSYTKYLKERQISDLVLKKVTKKTAVIECDYADVNLVDETSTLAYEIVLEKMNDRSFKCYQKKPFSLLTLVKSSEDGENEYEARCWNNGKWETKGMLKEGMNYKCEKLPEYRNEVASDSGTLSVNLKSIGDYYLCSELKEKYNEEQCCVSTDSPASTTDNPASTTDSPASTNCTELKNAFEICNVCTTSSQKISDLKRLVN